MHYSGINIYDAAPEPQRSCKLAFCVRQRVAGHRDFGAGGGGGDVVCGGFGWDGGGGDRCGRGCVGVGGVGGVGDDDFDATYSILSTDISGMMDSNKGSA